MTVIVSFVRMPFPPSGSTNDSPSTSSSSSVSLRILHRLDAPYIRKVYYIVSLVVSHPREETKEGDSATAAGSSPALGVSQKWRRILTKEVEKEKEEESLIPPSQGQLGGTGGTSVGGSTNPLAANTQHKGTPNTAVERNSFRVLEPQHTVAS